MDDGEEEEEREELAPTPIILISNNYNQNFSRVFYVTSPLMINLHKLFLYSYSLVLGNPSCLQATLASAAPHKSSHTVPQTLLLQISTRPCVVVPP